MIRLKDILLEYSDTHESTSNVLCVVDDTLLKKFGILRKKELDKFISWHKTNLYNHAKIKIGNIKTIIE